MLCTGVYDCAQAWWGLRVCKGPLSVRVRPPSVSARPVTAALSKQERTTQGFDSKKAPHKELTAGRQPSRFRQQKTLPPLVSASKAIQTQIGCSPV